MSPLDTFIYYQRLTPTNDTTRVAFTLALDDGTKQSGEITVARAVGGWAVDLHGRGRGDAVEVSFAPLPRQPIEGWSRGWPRVAERSSKEFQIILSDLSVVRLYTGWNEHDRLPGTAS